MKAVAVACIGIGLACGRQPVLEDITLRVEPGEFFALPGPSGSGNSTLLRLIADNPHLSRIPIHPRGARVQVGIGPGGLGLLP